MGWFNRTLAWAVLATSLAAGTAHAATAGIEKPHVTIAVGSKVGLFFLPTMLAEHLGYFKDEGLDVSIVDLATGGKALQGLVGGSVDVVSGAYDHTVQLRAKGIDLEAFVLEGKLGDYSLGLVKSKMAAYKSPKDLKGMRIGVSSPGSGSDMFLKLFLARAGLKPSDVSVISIGQSAGAVAAVRKGEIDGVANTDPVMTILTETGDVQLIADGRTPAGSNAVYGHAYPTGCLYATQEFVKNNPRTVQAMTNAVVRTLKWLQHATPDKVMAALPPEFAGGDPVIYKKALAKLLPTYSADGRFPPDSGQIAYAALANFVPNMSAAKGQLDQTFTNAFVQAAK